MRWFRFTASAFVLSCVLHVLMAGGFTLSGFVFDSDDPMPIPSSGEEETMPIDATVLDSDQIEAEMAAIIEADKRKKEAEADRVAKLEDKAKTAQQQREAEEARIEKMRADNKAEQERIEKENVEAMAELAAKRAEQRKQLLRQQQEAEKLAKETKALEQKRVAAEKKAAAAATQRKLEEQRAADAKRQAAEAETQRRAEEKRQAEAATKRLAQEKAAAAAAEKLEQAKAAEAKRIEAKRIADEKEAQRVAEEKRAAEAALVAKREAELKAQRKAEEAERRRVQDAERRRQELMAALAREESTQNARDLDIYRAVIGQKVNRNWTKPSGAEAIKCVVRVKQIPGGDVVDVQTLPGKCGGSVQYQNSVIKAVEKSSPLPEPSNPDVFDRVLEFTFNPDE